MKLDVQTAAVLAGAGVLALLALYVAKKGVAGAAAGAVAAAGEAASGAVVGIGQVIGIPATNETECERAKREGRTWDASFACPAGDFLGYVFGGSSATPAASYDEAERLARRYPAPEPERTTYFDDMGNLIGVW